MKIIYFWQDFLYKTLVETIIEDVFKEKIEGMISYQIGILESVIWNYAPNIVFLHCHTEESDFTRIKVLTSNIRRQLPKTLIVVTHHPDIDDDYRNEHLHGYENDLMISEYRIDSELINQIKKIYINKTTHNTWP